MVLMSLRRAMGGDRCAWLEFCSEGMWLKCGEGRKRKRGIYFLIERISTLERMGDYTFAFLLYFFFLLFFFFNKFLE